jgi:hypothetical protein
MTPHASWCVLLVLAAVMPYSNRDLLPGWYRNSGARRANKPT